MSGGAYESVNLNRLESAVGSGNRPMLYQSAMLRVGREIHTPLFYCLPYFWI